MKIITDLPHEVRESWRDILESRKASNMGIPVKTARGEEKLFTIQATERDLDDLGELLERMAKE